MNNTAIKLIKQLRAETGAGVQDCRKALEQSSEVYGQALRYLREKGLENRPIPDRSAIQGIVEVYSHGNRRVGVMVEVNCETDFAARSPAISALTHEIAL